VEPRDRQRCGRLLRDEVMRRRCTKSSEQRVGERFIDLGNQAVLGLAAQLADVELESLSQSDQQRTTDVPLVAFDQV
jgi:hypothetical protein